MHLVCRCQMKQHLISSSVTDSKSRNFGQTATSPHISPLHSLFPHHSRLQCFPGIFFSPSHSALQLHFEQARISSRMPEVPTLQPMAPRPASAAPFSSFHASFPPPLPAPSSQNLFEELEATGRAFSAALTTPFSNCFQWTSLLGDGERLWKGGNDSNQLALPPGRNPLFYLVVFRSIRGAYADDDLLYKADAEAQDEAQALSCEGPILD